MSLAIANDMELHKINIEQAFLQADKLDEGVNGRYFINPPPGTSEAGNKNIVYEVLRPLYGRTLSPRALHKTMDAYFKSEGFGTIGFEESVWVRPAGGKYSEDIYVSAHVADCLLSCKSLTVMAVLRVFNMWECNPVAMPLDPNVRLSKLDCPEVVDLLAHRKYCSISLLVSLSSASSYSTLVMLTLQPPTECWSM